MKNKKKFQKNQILEKKFLEKNIKIKKVEQKDIHKVIYEMNKIFVNTKKNKKFIIWQYFKNIYESCLYKIIKKKIFVGISGYQKKKFFDKKIIYQLIGLYIISKYRGKNYISKSINFIINNKFKKNPYFVIANENLKNSANKIFINYNIKKISALQITKNKIIKFRKNFKFIKSIELSKSNNFFFKNQKHFDWRYLNHPIYNYEIFESKKLILIFKFYKKNCSTTLDLTDCYIKKKITLENLVNEIYSFSMKHQFNKLNIWTFYNLLIYKNLKKMGFSESKKIKKYLIYNGIVNNFFYNKLISTGDADY